MSRPMPRLYDLLPAWIRYRDAYEGETLREVMDALEIPFAVLREDIDTLYRSWFIETCEEWLVPYIGDLLGVRGLESARRLVPTQRTRVANTLAYRRAKGTLAVVERAAADATGWPCRVTEFRQTVAATAAADEESEERNRYADLRQDLELDRLGGPFNQIAHTVDLKPADADDPPVDDRGGFHPLQVGLACWRLESQPVAGGAPGRNGAAYTFNPFGLDAPLFNPPRTADGAVYASTERNLPVVLRPFVLSEEIAALREGKETLEGFFGEDPAFRILVRNAGGSLRAIPPREIEICDLSGGPPGTVSEEASVLVDPALGRFQLGGDDPEQVLVDYSCGMLLDLGGGPYFAPAPEPPASVDWQAVVAGDCEPRIDPETGVHYFRTLKGALDYWNHGPRRPLPSSGQVSPVPDGGLIRISDSGSYDLPDRVELEGRCLVIQAGAGCRPFLRDRLHLAGSRGGWLKAAAVSGSRTQDPLRQNEIYLQGLWIENGIDLTGGATIHLAHCTLDPPRPAPESGLFSAGHFVTGIRGVTYREIPGRVVLRAERCILGSMHLQELDVELELTECVVDGGGEPAIRGNRTAATLVRSTLFGPLELERLTLASSVLFTEAVTVAVKGEGTVRFCHLAEGSRVPTQEACVGPGSAGGPGAVPAFTSTVYGDPGYAQLSPDASAPLRTGGEDGNEIGIGNALRQADRLANLEEVLDEYLPWGMAARISFVT